MLRILQSTLVVVLLAAWLASPVPAQNNGRDTPPPPQDSSSEAAREGRRDVPQFRAEVDQVVIYASVYDNDFQLVSGLTQEDFRVYEDRVLQEVTYFGQDDVPSTIGVVLDISGSMRNKMDLVNKAAGLFLEMNHPENELFLISFKDKVELEERFTRDPEDIRDAMHNLIVSGGTALYDAIYLAAEEARRGSEAKKALLIFTDGEDKDSYYTHEELIAKLEELDVQVYLVAFLDADLSGSGGFFGIFRSERQKVQEKMEAITEATGGKTFFPEKIEELDDVFAGIAQDLRNQYRIAYVSSNPTKDGEWRRIDVALEDSKAKQYRIRARKGYYAK